MLVVSKIMQKLAHFARTQYVSVCSTRVVGQVLYRKLFPKWKLRGQRALTRDALVTHFATSDSNQHATESAFLIRWSSRSGLRCKLPTDASFCEFARLLQSEQRQLGNMPMLHAARYTKFRSGGAASDVGEPQASRTCPVLQIQSNACRCFCNN